MLKLKRILVKLAILISIMSLLSSCATEQNINTYPPAKQVKKSQYRPDTTTEMVGGIMEATSCYLIAAGILASALGAI